MTKINENPEYFELMGKCPAKADIYAVRARFFEQIKRAIQDSGPGEGSAVMADWGVNLPSPPDPSSWLSLPERGWLILKEEPHRPFTLSVWQVGTWLRLGIKISPAVFHSADNLDAVFTSMFYRHQCYKTGRGDAYFYDWDFDVPWLYSGWLEQETWVMATAHLYEMAGAHISA